MWTHRNPAGRARDRDHGFTLIEMMVTVTVLAVLLGVGVPSFRSFIEGQKVKTATYDLTTSLLLARSEAVKRNTGVTLLPGSATAWAGGWAVKVPATALTLLQQQPLSGVTITPKDPGDPASPISLSSLDFGASGRPAAKAYFEISGSSSIKCVKVDPSGIPSSLKGACT